ncbi:ABC transporter substrate-binding protein [Nocardia fusca]|uniref:ABC transporter substrate-binding protein n=1 Tax=Nocardia fusca TaxID=941183 RepID=UPI00379BBB08
MAVAASVTAWVQGRVIDGCRGGTDELTVASAAFPESETIAEIYAQMLRINGFDVDTKLGLGGRDAVLPALAQCSVSVAPDFTGNLLQHLDPTVTAGSQEQIDAALPAALGDRLVAGAPAPAQDRDALVVTRATAQKWKVKTIADLSPHAGEVKFAAPPEFGNRPGGLPKLSATYGLNLAPEAFVPVTYDGTGEAAVQMLTSGQVTVTTLSSSSALIKQHDLVVLDDPRNAFAAQHVIPVFNTRKRSDDAARVLDAASEKLTTADLQILNDLVTGPENKTPAEAAEAWISAKGLSEAID